MNELSNKSIFKAISKITLVLSGILFLSVSPKLEQGIIEFDQLSRPKLQFMFYNVENLFDTADDPHKVDNEFLPKGNKHWTYYRYKQKLNNIYKVIMAVGESNAPALVGLCEIENRDVLEDLTQNTPLLKLDYSIVHHDSPDQRGIDVALLYQEKYFKVLYEEAIKIKFEGNNRKKTRDILYVKGLVFKKDTLHVFVNHWPSRRGGQKQSDKSRIIVARKLKHKTDSILFANPNAKIVITGDFNDEPEDASLQNGLMALPLTKKDTARALYNISPMPHNNTSGTLKYMGRWNVFDQFIVSRDLLSGRKGLKTTVNDYHVFEAEFLLQPDEKYTGKQPFPTYRGVNYLGGFSDHLPVYLNLYE